MFFLMFFFVLRPLQIGLSRNLGDIIRCLECGAGQTPTCPQSDRHATPECRRSRLRQCPKHDPAVSGLDSVSTTTPDPYEFIQGRVQKNKDFSKTCSGFCLGAKMFPRGPALEPRGIIQIRRTATRLVAKIRFGNINVFAPHPPPL